MTESTNQPLTDDVYIGVLAPKVYVSAVRSAADGLKSHLIKQIGDCEEVDCDLCNCKLTLLNLIDVWFPVFKAQTSKDTLEEKK